MHSDWNTFIQAYNDATLETKQLIDSQALSNFADALIEKYGIDVGRKRTLVAQCSDLVLSLVGAEELAYRLVREHNIYSDRAQELLADIQNFLQDPYRDFRAAPTETVSVAPTAVPQQHNLPEEPSTPPIAPNPEAKAPLRQTEELAARLERLRTMAQDADRIHGYGAYRRKYPTPEDARTDATMQHPQKSLTELPKYHAGA